jgi:hypothetical protein
MNAGNEKRVANVVLGTSMFALLLGIWALWTKTDATRGFWGIVLVVGVLAVLAVGVCMFLSFSGKLNVSISIATIILSFALGYYVLKLTGRDLLAIIDTKVVRSLSVAASKADSGPVSPPEWVSSRPVDARTPTDISKALNALGIAHNSMYNPVGYLALIDNNKMPPFLPLSSMPNAVTFGCNEGDQRDFPIWRIDRYGFNNDDTIYAYKDLGIFVGGSFAQGSCVHQDETLGGVLRRNGYPTANMGIGGFGAVAALATLKEYAEHLKPKVVLWQFYDPNDIFLLTQWDLRSSFLLHYLRDEFSQDLIHKQDAIIDFWKTHGKWGEAYREFYDSEKSPELKAAWEKRLDGNLPLVRQLLGLDISSLRDNADVLQVYEKIFEIAKRRVSAWGGKIYLVMIPNMQIYSGHVPKYQSAVVKIMQKLGIETIDADEAIRTDKDPMSYFALRTGWSHFNARGYRITAQQIAAKLDKDAASPAESPPALDR